MFSMGRPWSPLSVRLAFWKGLDEGLPTSAAARAAGVSRATAYRWLGEDRQVLPSPFQNFALTRSGSLSLREREEIGFQLARGQGIRRIAAALGRAPSTISREVARNRVFDRYVPSLAQEQTWTRARRSRPRKLDGLALRGQVVSMLTERFGLLRGFRTAELVDFSTLPGLAADNHSGLRWVVGSRARSAGAGCCKTPRCIG